MKLGKAKRTFGSEPNIAPLIDVVFQLIIFFMLVAQITRVEVEDLSLPEAKAGKAAREAKPGRVVINVHADGRIIVSGREHTPASLEGVLARERQARRADTSVLVRGDRETPWRTVAQILNACAAQQISRVRVAVVEPGAG